MANRFVWQKFNVSGRTSISSTEKEYPVTSKVRGAYDSQMASVTVYRTCTVNGSTLSLSNTTTWRGNISSETFYAYGQWGSSSAYMRTDDGKTIYMERGINGHAHSEEVSNGHYVVVIDDATADGYEVSIIYDQKGELQGYVSSAKSGQYPADGVSGSYWYTKQGSDNIDPISCSISSSLMGGGQATITVSPSTSKVYEGTVSYLYQYCVNGGTSWVNIGTDTATTKQFTVPAGVNSIQVRVRAQDNIGFVSTTYVTSSTATVINNIAPIAPSSITATNVVKNQTATVTWTAGSDSDGTIVSYTVQRKANGGSFTTIYTGSALTCTDTIGDWSTVTYQVQCTDDDGATSTWTQSTSYTVQSGMLVLDGPAYDLGEQSLPFVFTFQYYVSTADTSTTGDVTITLDETQVYSGEHPSDTDISYLIDTRFLSAGEHSLIVNVNDGTYVPVTGTYTFDVPHITIPDGGRIELLQNNLGKSVFPVTLARCVVTDEGQDVVTLINETNQLLNAILGVADID